MIVLKFKTRHQFSEDCASVFLINFPVFFEKEPKLPVLPIKRLRETFLSYRSKQKIISKDLINLRETDLDNPVLP